MRILRRARGFTLVELLVTMVVAAVVVSFMALFITTPVNTYLAQAHRSELNKSVESASESIGRDVRAALPNSLRTLRNGTVVAFEMLTVIDWARYYNVPVMVPASGQFLTTSKFLGIALPCCANGDFLAIEALNTDPYQAGVGMTPAGTSITITNSVKPGEDKITVAPIFTFVAASPTHHVFLVSGPVNYLCDESAGTLRRYVGYQIASNLATRDSAAQLNGAGASSSLVATNVATCNFAVSAGTPYHNQAVSLQVTFSLNGESITLMRQEHVEQMP